MKKIIISSLSVFITGCASNTAPSYYVMGAEAQASSRLFSPSNINLIGVDAVRLPAYAQSNGIASLTDNNKVTVEDAFRWAEPPEEAIQRSMAKNLRQSLGADVIASPYPRGMSANARIQIRFDSFIRAGKFANVSGQFIITDGRGREVKKVENFNFSEPMNGTDYGSFVSAIDKSLSRLSENILISLQMEVRAN